MTPQFRNKQLVAKQFSRAATTYDQAAAIQQQALTLLFFLMRQKLTAAPSEIRGRWADIGCGTGAAIPTLLELGCSEITACDISSGMLDVVDNKFDNTNSVTTLLSDADSLPVSDGNFSGIFSSLMLQWSETPDITLTEWSRVLEENGLLVCATLLPGTHKELKEAWQQVDQNVHVNSFFSASKLKTSITQAGFEIESWQEETITEHYPTLTSLLKRLKAIGATNVNPGRRSGLGGRQALKHLDNAYPISREGTYPLTYELGLFIAQKSRVTTSKEATTA